MKPALAVVYAFLLIGCGSTPADDPEALPVQAAQPPPPDPRIAEMQILLGELVDRIEVMNARLQRLEAGAPPPQATPQQRPAPAPSQPRRPATPTPSPANIGEAYREALTLYGRGRIDDSRAAFERILAADSSGDLADNALYWIGETHFVQGKFNEAIDSYRRLVSEYGDQNKAPDALMKMGLSYARLGDLGMARTTLESLIERYPYSTPAAAARLELERLKY